jgi:hypothetical protein
VCIQVWDYDMTVWALVVALLIAAVYLIPVGQHSVSSSNDSHTDEFQG